MALFTLSDIKFKNPSTTNLQRPLVGGAYESNIYRYPQDIGGMDKGHYLVIHINQQDHTQYSNETTSDNPTVIENRLKYGTPSLNTSTNEILNFAKNNDAVKIVTESAQEMLSKGEDFVNKNGGEKVTKVTQFLGGVSGTIGEMAKRYTSVNGIRTIKRTTDTIALYMPDTLNFVHNQSYTDLTLTGIPAALISGGASLAQSMKGNMNPQEFGKKLASNMSPYFASYILNQSDFGKSVFAATTGMVQNPMLELLYSSPAFRSFRFDFMFYPRSESEAEEVQDILSRLKFHQAPEIRKEYNSFFLVPPSEFDIKFYHRGIENPNIPKISTCVLETIDVDYAPNGFSAYEVAGEDAKLGRTGMPVGIRLSLQFKETEIMTKANFAEDARKNNAAGVALFNQGKNQLSPEL